MSPRVGRVLAALLAAAVLAGCASADKHNTQTTAKDSTTGASTGMAGMKMTGDSAVATEVPSVNGIKPVASQVLATADWQGMEIQARTMTPTTFAVFDGSGHEEMFKANRKMSFHLMIMLDDQHTKVPIPYAGVWATIFNSAGKTVFSERQWPMLSAYMGPHYGNNVTLPGAGHYTLKLLISPPVAARHLEYAHVWLKPHVVVEHFTWKPTA
jgi:uncharacterized protein involved in high-affinity Fe2+ transport